MAAARSKATGAIPWRVARRPLPQSESVTTLAAHHLAVKATHVAKKAAKAAASRNGHVDLKRTRPRRLLRP